jgi:hypothetical protein
MSTGYDPLSEYHLHNPELKLYQILEQIKDLIEESRTRAIRNNGNKKKEIVEQIQALLNEAASKRILQMLYRKNHIKSDDILIGDGGQQNFIYKNPDILLQILFLSAILDSYAVISQTLDIDLDEAKEIIEYLKSIFKFDDPLTWLQNFLYKNLKYRKILEKQVLLGHESIGQSSDTAEERKLKLRKKLLRDNSNKK